MSEAPNEKLKICHVITRMIVGGAQENTLLTMRGHIENGHDVTLVTGPSPGREGELLSHIKMPPFKMKLIPNLVREISVVQDFLAFKKLVKFFKEEKFDVVHTHSSKAGIIGRVAAYFAKVPVVVHTVHGQAFGSFEKPLKNALYIFLEWFAALFCHRIYAVAQAMIDQCVAAKVAPLDKYQVVYSGMDTAAFATVERNLAKRQELGIPEDAKTIVTVARLFEMKGYEFVIPCAFDLLKRYPNTHFLFIGDGPMRFELENKIKEANLEKNFHFAGLVSPEDVKNYLAQGDLLWHLSLREGLPRAAVQALAVGIPVIGFALDGTPEVVINDKTGFVTAPEDLASVVEKTAFFWDNPEKISEYGTNGRKMVIEQFDWRRMADILEAEYLRLYNLNVK